MAVAGNNALMCCRTSLQSGGASAVMPGPPVVGATAFMAHAPAARNRRYNDERREVAMSEPVTMKVFSDYV